MAFFVPTAAVRWLLEPMYPRNINAYHARLKDWVCSFRDISTCDFESYLEWFHANELFPASCLAQHRHASTYVLNAVKLLEKILLPALQGHLFQIQIAKQNANGIVCRRPDSGKQRRTNRRFWRLCWGRNSADLTQ